MTYVTKIEGDLRVAGDLRIDGSLSPDLPRSSIAQLALAEFVVPMVSLRTWDAIGTNLPGTAANDDLGLDGGTWATDSPCITTGDVKGVSTEAHRYARFQVALPPEYEAGETVVLRCHAGMKTTVADQSCTLDVVAYKSNDEAGIGSDICATAAQSMNSLTDADLDFTITPTGLTAGDVLDVRLDVAYHDDATGTAVIGQIGKISLLCDIRG
jgi:hypothetical protein